MGLQKAIEFQNIMLKDTGFENEYHKIDQASLNLNMATLGGHVTVLSYKDHASRTANKKPAERKVYRIPNGTLTTEYVGSLNASETAYKYLKSLSIFSGSTDL
jgi:hypothetical protein